MSWLSKYKYFKQGIIKMNTSEETQRFFKTNPTEDQLMILDEIEKKEMWAIVLIIFLILIAGMIFGGILLYYYLKFQFLLGNPIF